MSGGMSPSPGWYPDVGQPGRLRWFNGERWTEHRIDQPPHGDPVPPPPPDDVRPRTSMTHDGWRATQAPAGAPEPRGRLSGKAIASLLAGLVWLFGIASALGILLGILALREITRSNGAVRGRTLAILGILVSTITLGLTVYAALNFDELAESAKDDLAQRAAAAQLRAAAAAMDAVYAATGDYPTEVVELERAEFRVAADVTLALARVGFDDYCLEALHDSSATVLHLERGGEVTEGRCPPA